MVGTVIGIDPGAKSGFARYVDGQLVELVTCAPHTLLPFIAARVHDAAPAPVLLVFEDSRLQSYCWNARAAGGTGAALRAARNLGQVDGICQMLEGWCGAFGVPYAPVSPKGKGSKMDAAAFKHLTGCHRRLNQHERDAALVAWPYRNLTPAKKESA